MARSDETHGWWIDLLYSWSPGVMGGWEDGRRMAGWEDGNPQVAQVATVPHCQTQRRQR